MTSLDDFLADEALALSSSLSTNGNNPSLLKSLYAVDTNPDRRRVVRITGEPGDYKTEVVSDYNTIAHLGDEIRQMSDKLAGVKRVDTADSDDTPAEQAYLMQAWQALVNYVANCEDSDKPAAMQALKMVSNLMNGNDQPNQPAPTGAFGLTATANLDLACYPCGRGFSTENGFLGHVTTIHGSK